MADVLSSLFGSKPTLPPWKPLSLGSEQQSAITNNRAAQPGAAQAGQFTQDQILSMMKSVIPNFDQITGSASGNIASELRGEIPSDVSGAIESRVAAQNLASGTSGTGIGRNLVARDLGLTSLDLTQKGLSSAESWMASTERLLSPAIQEMTSMFITPAQQAAFDVEERNAQFEHDWLGNQISAMPDPVATGLFRTGMAVVGGVAGGVAGGPGGAAMGAQMGAGMAGNILGSPQAMPQYNFQSPAPNMNPNSAGDNFAWSSDTTDMFDSGFDFGGGGLMDTMAPAGDFGAGFGSAALGLA